MKRKTRKERTRCVAYVLWKIADILPFVEKPRQCAETSRVAEEKRTFAICAQMNSF